ncbi:sensor histidine kinase [Mucilaginibacter achroorhodeus]|uniref:Sensor histidine kinase n=1 Tax=Mucilaginibacter achroorhodeus TaxID=2599294 RepID=A0A563U664_9SPHI|nr:histidine kinase [Mucilaginibacter achroorhodeus]TWR26841.1 sensor histidine kinase [Mucilaginibacter achroorhodeus]
MLIGKINISLYWKCQLLGWSFAALYWGYQGYMGSRFNWWLGLLHFVTDVIICVLITHSYRCLSRRNHFQNLPLKQLIWRLVPAVIVLGIIYTFIITVKIHLLRIAFNDNYSVPYKEFFQYNVTSIFITGVRLMAIWLLAYHLYHYRERELQVIRDNVRLELISREAKLNNLSAQINPHFLFNSLNTVKALIADDPKSARRAIDLLSGILRTGLYAEVAEFISLEEELSLVNDYLDIEQLRFEERLTYSIRLVDGLQNIKIPRFAIQLLVENAIKHGIGKLMAGGLIVIKVEQVNHQLRISVQNPGKFECHDSLHGVGLKNLKERLLLLYNDAASLSTHHDENIVTMILNIPLV